jgi:hypothetical protein
VGVARTLIVMFLAVVLDLACPLMFEVREGGETTVQSSEIGRPRRAIRLPRHDLRVIDTKPVQVATDWLASLAHPAARWDVPHRSVRGTASSNPQPPAASPDDH